MKDALYSKPAGNEMSAEGADEQSLKVIGAAFGRTGTTSMLAALQQLGFGPVHHMTEVMPTFTLPLWTQLAKTDESERPAMVKEMLKGYGATLDFPSCNFYKDQIRAFPEAKVLLTSRSAEKWYKSAKRTILQLADYGKSDAIYTPHVFLGLDNWHAFGIWCLINLVPSPHGFTQESIRLAVYPSLIDLKTKEEIVAEFNRHEAEVEASVPAERFLKFTIGDGWEPLCKFLGVPVPDTPFPHINDGATFRRDAQFLGCAGYLILVLYVLLLRFLIRRCCCGMSSGASGEHEKSS